MTYADIHSHILYGLDDGAKALRDSVEMLGIARDDGTADIVATPHANSRYRFNPELIAQRIAELIPLAGIRIHTGCDFHLQVDNIEDALANPEKYTINHGSYLLVELPDFGGLTSTDEIFRQLLDAGMVPILTHPERNPRLQYRFDDIARWVDTGCLVQVTAASHTGLFGKEARKCARELMKRGLTHFIASDAHDCLARSPRLGDAFAQMADEWGEEPVRPLFVGNPQAVLRGEAFDVEAPPPRTKKWYRFW